MEQGQLWRQYVIAGVANIGILSTGYTSGWTSSAFPILRYQSTPVGPLSNQQLTLVGTLFLIGSIFGPFIAGFLASRIGRKRTLLSSSVPLLIGWILIAIATDVKELYAARIALGVGTGMLYVVSPMYCTEIATDDKRGTLGSFLQVFLLLGLVISYAVGGVVTYGGLAYIGIGIVTIFTACFYFMPDSPIYCLTKHDKETAARCLMTLRGKSRQGVESELLKLEADVQVSTKKSCKIVEIFRGSNRKAFCICCVLVFVQQFSGMNAVMFFQHSFFQNAGVSDSYIVISIIVVLAKMLASLMSCLLVDRLGRKILLLISTAGTTVAWGLFGLYFFQYEDWRFEYLPLIYLCLFVVADCLGLGSLPLTVTSELFPLEVKTAAVPIVTSFFWILMFAAVMTFKVMAHELDYFVTFWIFGVCCALGFFFTLFVVPETKGKSFNEIQDMLAGKTLNKDDKKYSKMEEANHCSVNNI